MNRLLITGATGFLGEPCVARAAAEFELHAVARASRELVRGAHFHRCDLLDATAVRGLIAAVRPTHLLHLAWIATPGAYWASPENHCWVEASKVLLTAFAECGGARAVVAGTCAEYDWSAAGVCDEFATPARPATVYGQCKNELREWCEASGLDVAWARLFFLYGPREHPARLVPSVTRALLTGEPAECSDGTQRRDFLHSADVADALVTLLKSDLVGPVNVGSGEPVAVKDVVRIVAQACGRPDLVRFGARSTPANEPPKARGELGWRPKIALDDGLRECADWWRARRAA